MIIVPTNTNLSCVALGALATMVNMPECDYCSIDELHTMYSKDSLRDWQQALTELETKEFVIRINNKYAVNKWKILQMKVVR